ncbi:30S ribosomal protein S16 [Candidatus Desantisbacteria bacterium CG2_30_40_21]|uniref:Small ribosomal subunit protein bS16 n=5 Tax=unclassified Candidatus Desantisiibacteriota TaxID=3106372 RepID=A0A2M7JD39_9BACT|nr:MAG: 30S ribosomal protein S16 [Candidatus Desantisbacteria bacterium CG2_30_40_21]PIP42120.1 MAG: 30S ribosomal protein S16 [Candidatus Desantisbacteria bacterium CG23_combo_of_CG06-09_8_20_14_all_40_23]PIX17301.1 MAG: 30S ribosomal protein S16 [Candidatus Desantisbacteria bacterium CG_4_8_14_3_um_filter_40_12]PIY20078.1 MAG: 30S ribosomal protein S16 [Candidatus Desantisbacteria bacterium CG_4_10_14_3_um_filter_40_18]PJB29258.1 MAG: 30S ribosomal protein S16 [Candidatus Desantisbacteria ba
MAVRIRLSRFGTKKKPCYRIVVMDSRSARNTKAIESVGYYHPVAKEAGVSLDEEKILNWLEKGAEPSQTVHKLLSDKGLMKKFHEMKQVASCQV